MDRSLDALAKSLAGEISRRESLRRVGVLLGGGALAYFGIGCAPDASPVAPNLVRPTVERDLAALVPNAISRSLATSRHRSPSRRRTIDVSTPSPRASVSTAEATCGSPALDTS